MTGSDVVHGYPQYPPQQLPQHVPYPQYVLVPGSPRRLRSRRYSYCSVVCSTFKLFFVAFLLVSLGALGFLLFPRQPELDVKGITVEKINLHIDEEQSIIPSVHLDVSLSLLLKIMNPNFFGVVYDKVTVYFSYRGDDLGKVESQGGNFPSRSVTMATARLNLQGTHLLEHATDLIADVSNRKVPLRTETAFSGAVEIFFLRSQIKMTVFCEMLVDPVDKEVINSDCSLTPFK